ncbi:sensor histidine kinase [Desulfitispora alkaliphila]|uniref:sensor histidine kinase n=1 Tax=Desulfitispora alkaliphila TaxID=622674 RepID=UPI003D1D5E08
MINLILIQVFLVLFIATYEAFGITISEFKLTMPILVIVSIASGIICIILIKNVLMMMKLETTREKELLQYKNDKELVELMREMRHDFNNHLTVIKGLIQLNNHDKVEEYINSLENDTDTFKKLMNLKDPIVAAYLIKTINELSHKGIDSQILIRSTLDESLYNGKLLVNILGNLIDNAIYELEKRLHKQQSKMTIEIAESDRSYIFSIGNSGEPLDKSTVKAIFSRGYTTKGTEGSGLGLHIVQQAVKKLDGEIEVDWCESQGAIFRVKLPKRCSA